MAYVITGACIDVLDASCTDVCPVDCIYLGLRSRYIHPDECIDCGACVDLCPVDAIFFADDVPAELSPYVASNAEFFTEVCGEVGRDTPLVAEHA